jgi:hypothetical protein
MFNDLTKNLRRGYIKVDVSTRGREGRVFNIKKAP